VKRLRAEIEPVSSRDFMRFLLAWQRVTADSKMEGPAAVESLVAQLEGFEAPAAAWESEILPARLARYEPSWLDDRCLAGHLRWARLRPRNVRQNGETRAAPVRSTPITLLLRRNSATWESISGTSDDLQPGHAALAVMNELKQHGASFFEELVTDTGLLRTQVEDALGELVALGLVASDSFAGLRALLVPTSERTAGRRRSGAKPSMAEAGRWAPTRRSADASAQGNQQAIEYVARMLLQRYGVVFWTLLAREADWLPPWRDLLRVYRRLEGRGEIRGGRFVAGFSGEQFALPEAVGHLRAIRREQPSGSYVSVSGADPLNLAGILTPGPKLAALTSNRVAYRDGVPVAMLVGGETTFLETLHDAEQWKARKALLRSASSGAGARAWIPRQRDVRRPVPVSPSAAHADVTPGFTNVSAPADPSGFSDRRTPGMMRLRENYTKG
jgi:ATP-dependent Lhr-like helicase